MRSYRRLERLARQQPPTPDVPAALEDFENSPLRFEYEVLLQEYRESRAELNLHLSTQHDVTNYELALLAALVSLGPSVLQGSSDATIRLYLLGGSFVFSSIGLLLLWHTVTVAFLAAYISAVIKPRLEAILEKVTDDPKQVLLWESFLSTNRMRKFPRNLGEGALAAGNFILSIVPGIGLYVLALSRSGSRGPFETALVALASLTALLLTISLIYVLWAIFAEIAKGPRAKLRVPH